ncbi:hypothetical protein [Sneathiella sp.]|jgi:hypothetical protein|uniref:hypothetical protein n=1 Tax=Sneathiella sp. TaxID=1964365 RepID=UPI0039E6EB9D
MPVNIHEAVKPQLSSIDVDPDRPLIISDADEVLFNFMHGLEIFLRENDMFFDWSSFALHGNIRYNEDKSPVAKETIPGLLDQFFDTHCHRIPAVAGAAEQLEKLSQQAQIVILSNIPPQYADKRREGLVKNGMDFPLIANVGAKGHVVEYLTRDLKHPSFFIDDIPTNHSSVLKHAKHVERLHYVADDRLSRMLAQAEDSHVRLNSWPDIHNHIVQKIENSR